MTPTPRQVFEILEKLVKKYGYKKIKTTVDSMFEILEKGE